METIFFQAKQYHPQEQGDEASGTNKKIFIIGIAILCLAVLLFFCNNFILQNDKLEKIAITIGIIGFMLNAIARIQYQTDNDILSGNLRGTITFENTKLIVDDNAYDYNEVQNFKYISLNYKDPYYEISYLDSKKTNASKGIYNWIAFSHKNQNHKYYFLLENKQHQIAFLNTIELLKSKIPIKKAYDF